MALKVHAECGENGCEIVGVFPELLGITHGSQSMIISDKVKRLMRFLQLYRRFYHAQIVA